MALTTAGVCFVGFAIGLVMCTPGGEFLVDVIDHFTSTYCLLLVGFAECINIGWVYDLYAHHIVCFYIVLLFWARVIYDM